MTTQSIDLTKPETYAHLVATERAPKPSGQTVALQLQCLGSDRYAFDFDHCRPVNGWHQFDTSQDAWYFGVWYHTESRTVAQYCEGDIYITRCANFQEWKKQIEELCEFYGSAPPCAVGLDPATGEVTEFYDTNARPALCDASQPY